MCRKLACFASIVVLVGLLSPLAVALETYDFDGLEDLIGDFNKDASVDGKDFLTWQLGGSPFPLSASDLTDWEDNYGTTTTVVDPTDWMTTENWSDGGFDPDIAFGPLLPGFTTRVEIEDSKYGDNAPVIGPGDTAEAFGVRIARFGGPGLLTMTGGTLTVDGSRFRVGNAEVLLAENRHPGTFNLSGGEVTTDSLWIGSGSHGEMNMSGGEVTTIGNFYMDWTSDLTYNTNSVLNMTAGTIEVGGILRLFRLSSLNLDGGEIRVEGAAELGTQTMLNPVFLQDPNVTVSITAGLLKSGDFLQIGGSVVLDGGILRANSFNETLSAGTVEINGGGLLQFKNSLESVAAVEALITSGWFTTMNMNGLEVTTVDVSGTNFTQVAVAPPAIMGVPEPSSVVLALLVSVSLVFRRRNFRGKKVGMNQFS